MCTILSGLFTAVVEEFNDKGEYDTTSAISKSIQAQFGNPETMNATLERFIKDFGNEK